MISSMPALLVDEDSARALFEQLRWPDGVRCLLSPIAK